MQKTQEILKKAEEMFLKYGIKSVTMEDMARALGISKKTLYTHFDNKEKMVGDVVLNHIAIEKEDIDEIIKLNNDPIEEFLMIAKYVMKTLRKMKPTLIYDLQKYYGKCWQNMDSFHREYVYSIIFNNLSKGIGKGLYREDINPDIIARLYTGATLLITNEEFFPLADFTRAELYAQFVKHHMYGIVSEKGISVLNQHQKTIQEL